MKILILSTLIGLLSVCARSEPKDSTVFPLLTVKCDQAAARLEIEVSYVEDLEGLHAPLDGRYDFEKLVRREEIPGTTRPDYTTSVETFRQQCSLNGQEFIVEITGKAFAGS